METMNTYKVLMAAGTTDGSEEFLQGAGSCALKVKLAETGKEVLKMTEEEEFDCILLDLRISDPDPFDVLSGFRERDERTPVILMSADHRELDVLRGLTLGADAFVDLPYSPVLLSARIIALIRRCRRTASAPVKLTAGRFELDLFTMEFRKDDRIILLTAKESALMRLFMENTGRILSKNEIYRHVWGSAATDNTVIMIYINRLRKKIEEDPSKPSCIVTVRGLGYRFASNGTPS